MQLGDYRIDFLDTGSFRLDGGAMFGVVPKVLWEKTNPSDSKNRIDMALRAMLVRGHGKSIIIDTGIGHKWSDSLADRYAIDHSRSTLDKALAAIDVTRDSITDVVITHLHFDHVGGATRVGEGGKFEMNFPKARYWVHEKNLSHAHAPSDKDRASFMEHTIDPVAKSSQLKVSKGNDELAPGVTLWITHGHTPGQQLLKVTSGGETIFFCGDTIPTSSHVPLPYVMAFDIEPLKTIEEKREILLKAVAENWTLAFCHDPKIALAKVRFSDGKYAAAPV